MLNFGFWELVVIGTIALVVIGPDRLPEAARFIGHFFRRITKQVQTVKAEIRREIDLEDMKHIHQEFADAKKNAGNVFTTEINQIKETTKAVEDIGFSAQADNNSDNTPKSDNPDNPTADKTAPTPTQSS